MVDGTSIPRISPDDFARRFSFRAANLMWLLGAGASASAGIPTAWDMMWKFKQQLYISQNRVHPQRVSDLSNPAVRSALQRHIDSAENLPPRGAPDEYAALFEAAYPAEADRRSYIAAQVEGAQPSYGHIALATLMKADLARLVWTTNFDSLVADACAKVYGTTSSLTTIDLDAPSLASERLAEQDWPVEVKLHGDFRSRRLKNTSEELRRQDALLRQALIDSSRRYGLIVVGYSGRDQSIMKALEEVLEQNDAFPAGLFWLHREDSPLLPDVGRLLQRARELGRDVALVPVENFDEVMRDLIRLLDNLDTKTLDKFGAQRRTWSPAPRLVGRGGWPVVRLNALRVVEAPTVCRLVVCDVGGFAETREAVKEAGVDLVVARIRAGVLAFGSDSDVRTAFAGNNIREFDLHTIHPLRLRYESGERGLLRDALARAISRRLHLELTRRRSADLLAPSNPGDAGWAPLRRLVHTLHGTVANCPELRWSEGIGIRLDWANDELWLLFEPRTVFYGIGDENRAAAADFARERAVRRYNREMNELIAFWATKLGCGGDRIQALGISDGVDAPFRLSCETAFSRRLTP